MDYSADFALSDEERRKLMLSNALLGLGAGLMQSGRGFSGALGGAGTGLLAGVGLGQRAVADAREGKIDQAKMAEYMRKQQEAQAAAASGAQLNTDLANVPPGAAQYEQAMKRAEMAANAGDVKRAEQYQKMAEFYRVKYGLTPQEGLRDGKPVMFVTSESGEQKELPYGVKPKYERVDTGGAVKFYDPLTGGAGGEFPKTVTPGDTLSAQVAREGHGVTMRGQNMTDARAREGNAVAAGGKVADTVSAIRKEYGSLDAVKNYRAAVPVVQSAMQAPDTPAGDIDLIYAVGKTLDPNSVVREGELNLVIASGSPLQKFQGYVNYIAAGRGRLPPAQRKELITMLNGRAGQLKAAHDAAAAPYVRQAEAYGLPMDQVFQTEQPPGGQGKLTAAEQQELDQLRKRFGRR